MALPETFRLLWTAAVVSLIGVLISGLAANLRLWLLTILALLAAPSSFVTAPVANWCIGRLDVENSRTIDLIVGMTMAFFGYVQWFVLPRFFKRAGGVASQDGPTADDSPVVVFRGDEQECMWLRMLLERSGIEALSRNCSMEENGGTDIRVFVRSDDLDRVGPLVEHFQERLRNAPTR